MRNPPTREQLGISLWREVNKYVCKKGNEIVKKRAFAEHRRWDCDERESVLNEIRRSMDRVLNKIAENDLTGKDFMDGVMELEDVEMADIAIAKRCWELSKSEDDKIAGRAIDAIARFKTGAVAVIKRKTENTDSKNISLTIKMPSAVEKEKEIELKAEDVKELPNG